MCTLLCDLQGILDMNRTLEICLTLFPDGKAGVPEIRGPNRGSESYPYFAIVTDSVFCDSMALTVFIPSEIDWRAAILL